MIATVPLCTAQLASSPGNSHVMKTVSHVSYETVIWCHGDTHMMSCDSHVMKKVSHVSYMPVTQYESDVM